MSQPTSQTPMPEIPCDNAKQALALVRQWNEIADGELADGEEAWWRKKTGVTRIRDDLARAFRANPASIRLVSEKLAYSTNVRYRSLWKEVTKKTCRKFSGRPEVGADLTEEEARKPVPELADEASGGQSSDDMSEVDEIEEDVVVISQVPETPGRLGDEPENVRAESPPYDPYGRVPEPEVTPLRSPLKKRARTVALSEEPSRDVIVVGSARKTAPSASSGKAKEKGKAVSVTQVVKECAKCVSAGVPCVFPGKTRKGKDSRNCQRCFDIACACSLNPAPIVGRRKGKSSVKRTPSRRRKSRKSASEVPEGADLALSEGQPPRKKRKVVKGEGAEGVSELASWLAELGAENDVALVVRKRRGTYKEAAESVSLLGEICEVWARYVERVGQSMRLNGVDGTDCLILEVVRNATVNYAEEPEGVESEVEASGSEETASNDEGEEEMEE